MSRFTWLAAIAALGLSACGDRTDQDDTAYDAATTPSSHDSSTHSHDAADASSVPVTAEASATHLSAYASACVDQGEWSLEKCQCMNREADARLSVPAKAYLTATMQGDSAQANNIARDNGARVAIDAIAFLTQGEMACS